MKTVYIMRHAKSDWGDAAVADHDRPLNKRGKRAADRMGRYLAENGIAPDLALVSTALRTRTTWQRLSLEAGWRMEARFDEGFYHATAENWLQTICGLPPDTEGVLIIGHNPGLHILAATLAGSKESELYADLATAYPTGALAELRLPGDWSETVKGAGELMRFVKPRLLAD